MEAMRGGEDGGGKAREGNGGGRQGERRREGKVVDERRGVEARIGLCLRLLRFCLPIRFLLK